MNGKLAAWLRKEIRPLGPPRVPFPLARKLGRWVRIGLLAVFWVMLPFWAVCRSGEERARAVTGAGGGEASMGMPRPSR